MTTPVPPARQNTRPEDAGPGPARTTGPSQPQQADLAQRPDAKDDPASDANTESANHPNDDE